ncbi:MAG TPA: flagellar hook assembly protein FlgD [Devosia sp.]|nr:flagellar hook assembly protein FlgD [Devosia sp.]
MAVNSIGGTPSSLVGSRNTIADNFETFLSLLTTQLRNQNPLDPLDTNQFTSQMVEFTSVEQQLKTNEFLEALVISNLNSTYTEAVSFIGKTITSSGSSSQLANGEATWSYDADANAENSVITITDSFGNVVHTEEASLIAGEGTFSWDGKDANGNQMPDGAYTITIDARDGDGAYVPVTTQMSGTVSGVDLSESEPVLIVNGARIYLSSVTSVRMPETA